MLIRLLCAHVMTKHVCKISNLNSKRLLRKLQKNLGGYFILPHPVYPVLCCLFVYNDFVSNYGERLLSYAHCVNKQNYFFYSDTGNILYVKCSGLVSRRYADSTTITQFTGASFII